jgi:hypothetical protein
MSLHEDDMRHVTKKERAGDAKSVRAAKAAKDSAKHSAKQPKKKGK